ncbi:MAG TPA: glycine cleavage T C-terminal barrel domain-containing protein [Acidimicrobiales bacterium]|nr:glycine cleavage T C-terminal barrel domain-containing protein [Acidimicrobiales bacterium]
MTDQSEQSEDGEVAGDYAALREEVGAVWLNRDFLKVEGPDTFSWLQGQLSQDVSGLAVGDAVESFLLQPQGKVDALVRITRTDDEEAVIDVDGGFSAVVVERLNRFKLRVEVDLEDLDWRCLGLRGPKAHDLEPITGAVVDADWPGLPGVDVIGVEPGVPEDVRLCGDEAWQAVRIEAGIPLMGAELNERTIPAEAGVVERTVSFTKGCFTGQELVARIDSRGGNVPRQLRGVVMAGDRVPPVGAVLAVEGKEVGSLTSVARSPRTGAPVALAYVRRDVTPPADGEVRWEGGQAPARIETLPLA